MPIWDMSKTELERLGKELKSKWTGKEEKPISRTSKVSKAFMFGRDDSLVLVIPKEFEKELELIREKPFTLYFQSYLDDKKLVFEKIKLKEVV
jgi:hypothetical protein